jgi:ppGpp synthetase/RelA/SpoT-type nucleotidyltranferase
VHARDRDATVITVHGEAIAVLRQEYEGSLPLFEDFRHHLQTFVEQICNGGRLDIDAISSRVKQPDSVVEKVQRKGYNNLNEITDKVGVRIVTRYASGIADAVAFMLADFRKIDHVKHQYSRPDSFGYTSEHVLVQLTPTQLSLPGCERFVGLTAEIQVRSILQHAWASIEHKLVYKSGIEAPPKVRRQLSQISALLEAADDLFELSRLGVEDAIKEYGKEVKTRDWTLLPVNVEALVAAWGSLPVGDVFDVSVAAGFFTDEGARNKVEPWHSNAISVTEQKEAIPRLVGVALAAGIGKLGEIAQLMNRVAEAQALLTEIATRGEHMDYRPHAIVADVVTLYLLATLPSPSVYEAAARHNLTPHLIDAARIVQGKQNSASSLA